MTAAQAVVASLEAEGVTHVFGYPGGTALQIYDALLDSTAIVHILARHEQGAVHEADGYARASGQPGTVIVTSGPGATNTVTGIATAYMDSVPLVVITAQVPRSMIGTDSFQESDIVGITLPIVKHSYLVQNAADVPRRIREAYHIAKTGRPGPVLIDIPSDVLAETLVFHYPDEVNIPSYRPTYKGNARQVRAAVTLMQESSRPVLYVGGGVISSGASEQVIRLSQLLQAPIVTTLMGKGSLPADLPLNLGHVGMHGSRYANLALDSADLIIALGARFSDRVTGDADTFAPNAKVVHIDIDPAEIGKNRYADVPIVGDLATVLDSVLAQVAGTFVAPDTSAWLAQIDAWRQAFPLVKGEYAHVDGTVSPERLLMRLSDALNQETSIVVTEVGQHQMWAAQHIARSAPRSFLSSGGLGTMGFGLPAAIGAAIACPDKQVVCISGDGSLQMNSQEMATAAVEGAAVKVVLLNNSALGMVRQQQHFMFDSRYSQTKLPATPDFIKLAEAYGWNAARVDDPNDVESAIAAMLASDGPYLLDAIIPQDADVLPMILPGKSLSQMIEAS